MKKLKKKQLEFGDFEKNAFYVFHYSESTMRPTENLNTGLESSLGVLSVEKYKKWGHHFGTCLKNPPKLENVKKTHFFWQKMH